MTDDRHYLLDHTDRELRRLDTQGDLYRSVTLRAFHDAGIGPGDRVLDLGCGSGDVSVTVAGLVGPGGHVLGIDRGDEAVAAATEKAASLGLPHVSFEVAEILEFERPDPFDAVVGRFVLMHQPDPAHALRAVVRSLRPGGVVAMIESSMDLLCAGAHSTPPVPLYDDIVRFKCAVVRAAGADLSAGTRLRATFLGAGLPEPICHLEARLEGGPDSPYYAYVQESVRSMLPEAHRTGVSAGALGDIDTLADRLCAEAQQRHAQLVVWPAVAAIARI